MVLHQAGRLNEAGPVYAEILATHPRAYPPLHLMGDTAATTRHVEAAYRRMLERWARGETTQSFNVSSQS
jgi:hypothetical protein